MAPRHRLHNTKNKGPIGPLDGMKQLAADSDRRHRRRLPHHQLGQQQRLRLMSLAGDQRLSQLQRPFTEQLQRLRHRRQPRLGVGRQLVVIKADDGELLRHPLADLLGVMQSPNRHVSLKQNNAVICGC